VELETSKYLSYKEYDQMPKVVKLSVGALRKMIAEEKASISDVSKEAKKTKEVEADDYADTLEKDVNHLKAMKVKEARLIKQLKSIRETMKAKSMKVNETRKKRK